MPFAFPSESVFAFAGILRQTTAIKILMNIHQPTAGRAEISMSIRARLAPAQLAQIGYVSENQEMPEWMTVDYFMAYLKPFYPTWDDALSRRTRSPVRPAARPQAEAPIPRHENESRAGLLSCLSAKTDRAGRTLQRPRPVGPR